jgi:hypothetical protein
MAFLDKDNKYSDLLLFSGKRSATPTGKILPDSQIGFLVI